MVTNSVVPIAKPPTASAKTASPKFRVVEAGRTSVVVVIVTILQRTGDEDLFLAAAWTCAAESEGGERLVQGLRRAHHR
jgi:hypothetical protein